VTAERPFVDFDLTSGTVSLRAAGFSTTPSRLRGLGRGNTCIRAYSATELRERIRRQLTEIAEDQA
jgi:hypothetical protein